MSEDWTAERRQELDTLREENASLREKVAEARGIVAKVNNEVIGSGGYFTTPSCVEAVQNIKHYSNEQYRRAEQAEAKLAEMIRVQPLHGSACPYKPWEDSPEEPPDEVTCSCGDLSARWKCRAILEKIARNQAEAKLAEVELERGEAMAVLRPNVPESGLVDACRQVKQAAISWEGNCATAEAKLAEVRALMERQFVDIDDVCRHRLARMVLAILDAQAAKETA